MDQTLTTIKILQEGIQQQLSEREKQKKRSLVDHLAIKALEGYSDRLHIIADLLRIEQYDLVFIGQVGTGKTTSISYLFNLTYEGEVMEKGKRRKALVNLLPTGSGRTTLCEMLIKPDQSSLIEIETYDPKDFEQVVKQYCDYIWGKIGKDDSDQKAAEALPAELNRAINNIVGLKMPALQSAKAQGKSETVPPVEASSETEPADDDLEAVAQTKMLDREEFARQFSDVNEFYEATLARANLEQRTRMKIEPPQAFADEEAEKRWIGENARRINVVSLPDIPLPKKVIIHVRAAILQLGNHSRISAIIDTKGLETDASRKDVEQYIRNQPNALCVFCDRFPGAPSGIAPTITFYLTDEASDLDTRSAVFVLPYGDEPEKITNDTTGAAIGDWDEGCELRERQIIETLTGKAKFVKQNIIFYDAMRYYRKGRPDIEKFVDDPDDEDERRAAPQRALEAIEQDKQRVLGEIEAVIQWRIDGLRAEVETIRTRLQKIKEQGGLSDADRVLIKLAKKAVLKAQQRDFSAATEFVPELLGWLGSLHWRTVRAIQSRFGNYKTLQKDIYYQSSVIATTLTRSALRPTKEDIQNRLKEITANASNPEDVGAFIDQFIEDIDTRFENLTVAIGGDVGKKLEAHLSPLDESNEFWLEVQNQWGTGYRDRVITLYQDKLEPELTRYIKRQVEKRWQKDFIEPILDIFGNEEL
ncbi:hypothetical protein HC928_19610 [bacterium]|nr:hypothetical protein [bacterium]